MSHHDAVNDMDRAIRKLKVAIFALLATVLFAAGGFVYNVVNVSQVAQRVTRVERSPCYVDPTSRACQTILRQASVSGTVEDGCIIFRKVLRPAALPRVTRCTIPE